jgi:DNA-directed RNA polymerase specialized sigma24 family protein
MALTDQMKGDLFTEFVAGVEPRLRQVLSASLGPDLGREATADALAYGWEHWDRISVMQNPVGYLFRVGQRSGRRMRPRAKVVFPMVATERFPWVEPGLPDAMRRLPDRQRTVVFLLYAYEWSMSEVATVLGVSKATVQSASDRALVRLRKRLGVEL